MSSKFFLAVAFGLATMLGLGVSTILKPGIDLSSLSNELIESSTSQREMASEKRIKQPRISGKMRGDQISRHFYELQFVDSSLEAGNNQAVQKLAVRIRALKDVPAGLRFKWSFSDSVNILSSPELTEGELPSLRSGQEHQLEIEVDGFNKLSQQFANLVVSGDIQGFKVARNLILPSRPEDTLEYAIHQATTNTDTSLSKNRFLKTGDGTAQQGARPTVNVNELKKRFSPENVIR